MKSRVSEVIKERFSAREYSDRAIEEDKTALLKDALRLAPSGKNAQPWKFIFVRDKAVKKGLRKACKGQVYVEECPLVVVGVAFPEKAYPAMGGYWNSSVADVTVALTQLVLQAKDIGLDTCYIGAFYEEEVKKVLEIPENALVVSLITVGYSGDSKKTGRNPEEQVFCYDKFSE